MEDVVRVPVLLRLQELRVGVQAPEPVSEVSTDVTGRGVEVLGRDVTLVEGPFYKFLLDFTQDSWTGDVSVGWVRAETFL